MVTHQARCNKVDELAARTLESIAEDVIDAEREVRELQDENSRLLEGIRRIAGDFIPDNNGQAPLALQEMREALEELVSA